MKSQIWNIIFAAIVTAFLGCLGYLLTSISELQKKEASREALEFTNKDAIVLQEKLTDVMTNIDLRISLMERDVQWIKSLNMVQPPKDGDALKIDVPGEAVLKMDIPTPPVPNPLAEPAPRRYDFRQNKE